MLSAIAFSIKLIIAAIFVVILSLGRSKIIPKDEVGNYALLSITLAAITVVSNELNIPFLITSVFFIVSFISYKFFQKSADFSKKIHKLIPLWSVMILGVFAGSLMLLQGAVFVFIAYYIVNYFPSIINNKNKV
tara:strand:- start:3657 stop:4058 length:402 start_codon:yes stop_codon:yes gene_type:complete